MKIDPHHLANLMIITPLIGGISHIYLEQAYPIARDNLKQFLGGHPEAMSNIVPH